MRVAAAHGGYFQEANAFSAMLRLKSKESPLAGLSSTEIGLLRALIDEWNLINTENNTWETGSRISTLTISMETLKHLTGYTKRAIDGARKSLRDKQLLDFTPGENFASAKGKAEKATYTLISFMDLKAEYDAAHEKPAEQKKAKREKVKCAGFTEFWEAYPFKKDNPASAERAWNATAPDAETQRIILEDIRYRTAYEWKTERYCPSPRNYIMGMKWKDAKPPQETQKKVRRGFGGPKV